VMFGRLSASQCMPDLFTAFCLICKKCSFLRIR
ncbi:hypothetical protein M2135_003196, partial [Parabacteroides sp. PF5-9]|nr:hypothetical protein [Parabacteroides sp. PF5-9]